MSGLSAAQQLTSFTIIPTAAQGNQQPKYQKVDRNDNIVQPKIIYAPGSTLTTTGGNAAAATVTQNQQAGSILLAASPTNAQMDTLTVTNSFVTTTSVVLVTVKSIGNAGTGVSITIISVVPTAGQFVINFQPVGSPTDVVFGYQVIN
jgi:hypothetical protein